MSNRLKQLREQRQAHSNSLAKLMEETDRSEGKSGRAWSKETDQPVYDAAMGHIADIDAEISRLTDFDKVNADLNSNPPTISSRERQERNNEAKSVVAKNYDKWLRRGWSAFDQDEISELRNAMSTTTDSEGGYTVDSEVSASLIEAKKEFGGMREAATVIRTAKGNKLSWPTTDGTSEVGEIVDENAAASSADLSFGTVPIDAFKYGSKVITVPFELMQDSEVDIEALVRRRVSERIARIENTHFTVGDGSGKPRGVVTAATVGKAAASGQTASLIYNDFVDLMHSVDPAYRKNSSWMMNDATLQSLYKLVDSDGRPLFWAASRDLSDALPMTLLGRTIRINQDMAAPGVNAKPLAFGDFSKYIIRDVMAVSLFRFMDSKYVEKGQVGFLAWMRADGNYTDNGASMKVFQNAAS